MPIFKTTHNILKKYDEDELFNPNWMDSNKLQLPSTKKWDYKRELTIEDVSVWELIYESTDGKGLYVAWDPQAEFYMLTAGTDKLAPIRWVNGTPYYDRLVETYYGINAAEQVLKRAIELEIPVQARSIWVSEDEFLAMSSEKTKTSTYLL